MKKRRKLKPWHGLVFFLIVMVMFYVVCVPMQFAWGIYGVVMTELLLLVLALIFTKIMGYPLRMMFPVKSPALIPLLGTIVFWLGCYLITMVVSLVQYRLFPEQMTEISQGLNGVIYSVSFWLSVLFVSILPAICEEAVHRGVILHTLYSIRKKWIVVGIMGIYFGLFHTDPLRFLPTAILGAAISYIMLETENMFYSSFFHFFNNLVPIQLMSSLNRSAQTQEILDQASQIQDVPIVSIGIYMIFAALSPFLIYLGNYMLHFKEGENRSFFPHEHFWKTLGKILIPTAILFFGGAILFVYGVMTDPMMRELITQMS